MSNCLTEECIELKLLAKIEQRLNYLNPAGRMRISECLNSGAEWSIFSGWAGRAGLGWSGPELAGLRSPLLLSGIALGAGKAAIR